MAEVKFNLDVDNRSGPTVEEMVARAVGYAKAVLVYGAAPEALIAALNAQGCHVTVSPGGDSAGSFDAVVLDGLAADPLATLRQVRRLLVPSGSVVAALPNATHGSVRLSVLAGEVPLADHGGVDAARWRWFTRTGIDELFRDAGYVVADLQRYIDSAFEGETISPEVMAEVKSDPESSTYRFVVQAVADNGLEAVRRLQAREEGRLRALATYRVQCAALESDRDRWLAKAQALEEGMATWQGQAEALEAEREEWIPQYEDSVHKLNGYRSRAQEAEARLKELDSEVDRLRADVDALRGDRDAWRGQAERLVRSQRTTVKVRGTQAAKSVWSKVPEPARAAARPVLRRIRVPLSGASENNGSPAPDAAAPGAPVPPAAPAVLERVSVLIPTLNGGPGFARTLDAILSQQGLASLELIVADSGSTDGTRDLAEAAGARMLDIAPGEFNHGGTRNRMAELATGDVFVMTVQDARLVGRTAIRDLVGALRAEPRSAAVSARAIPRRDADLFASFLTLSHQGWIENHGRDRTGLYSESGTVSERRVASWMDNVCSAIDRKAWEDVRFRQLAFAEDIDFGMRAASRGWRLRPCFEVGVVHSHNRDACYHLRRIVVDRMFLGGLLGDTSFHRASGSGVEAVAGAARQLVGEIEAAARAAAPEETVHLDTFLQAFARELKAVPEPVAPTGELANLAALLAGSTPAEPAVVGTLRFELLQALEAGDLAVFAGAQPPVSVAEALEFLAKLSTRVIGTAAGDAVRADPSSSPLGMRLQAGV